MKLFVALVALASVVYVSAATIVVAVGENNGLTFNPTSVNASQGDTIAFQFKAKNHTVTQSTFAAPCTQMTTPQLGIDSGFMAVPANATSIPEWSFTVDNASAPLWFYCMQTGHCAQGMVFAVNPSPAKTFAAFQAAAMNTSTSTNSTTSSSSSSGSVNAGSAAPPSASAITSSTNGASLKLSFNAAGVLTVVGLVTGIIL